MNRGTVVTENVERFPCDPLCPLWSIRFRPAPAQLIFSPTDFACVNKYR